MNADKKIQELLQEIKDIKLKSARRWADTRIMSLMVKKVEIRKAGNQ